MKKIITLIVMAVCLGFGLPVYAASDTPEYIDGYEVAEFDKFNSYASDNGLGGTNICVEGEVVAEVINGDVFALILQQDDKQTWLVSIWTPIEDLKNAFPDTMNKEVRVLGEYIGFSDIFHMPAIFVNGYIYEKTDEEQFELIWSYEDWLEDNPDIVQRHQDEHNTGTSTAYQDEELIDTAIYDVSYQVPKNWYNTLNESGIYTYYYPLKAMIMLQINDFRQYVMTSDL